MAFEIRRAAGQLIDLNTQEAKAKLMVEIAFVPQLGGKGRFKALAELEEFDESLWNKKYILQLEKKSGQVYLASPLFAGSNMRQTPLLLEGPEWSEDNWFAELPEAK